MFLAVYSKSDSKSDHNVKHVAYDFQLSFQRKCERLRPAWPRHFLNCFPCLPQLLQTNFYQTPSPCIFSGNHSSLSPPLPLTLEHASCCSQGILFSISLSARLEEIPLMYAYQLNVFSIWSSSLQIISSNQPFFFPFVT